MPQTNVEHHGIITNVHHRCHWTTIGSTDYWTTTMEWAPPPQITERTAQTNVGHHGMGTNVHHRCHWTTTVVVDYWTTTTEWAPPNDHRCLIWVRSRELRRALTPRLRPTPTTTEMGSNVNLRRRKWLNDHHGQAPPWDEHKSMIEKEGK